MLTFLNHLQMHCFPFLPLSFRMEVSEVSQFAVLVVGDGEGQVAASSFDDGARCLICLEPFREAEEGTEAYAEAVAALEIADETEAVAVMEVAEVISLSKPTKTYGLYTI